jgi:hypothetical protein
MQKIVMTVLAVLALVAIGYLVYANNTTPSHPTMMSSHNMAPMMPPTVEHFADAAAAVAAGRQCGRRARDHREACG